MTTTEDRIIEFIPRALTKAQAVHEALMNEFDYRGHQNDESNELLEKTSEIFDFIELLNTSTRGDLAEKEINDLIDFFNDYLSLDKILPANYINYSLPIVKKTVIINGDGDYATSQELAAEISARQIADAALAARIQALEDYEPDYSTLFPEGFFDNHVTTYSVVFDDDERLHDHSNIVQLDQINADDLVRIKALEAHYASIGEPGGQHVSLTDRANWNNAAAGNFSALIRTIPMVAHGFIVGDVLTLNTDGDLVKVSNPDSQVCIGIVTSVTNADVFVMTISGYAVNLSGLVKGKWYYAQADGTISQTVTALPVLIADSISTGYMINRSGSTAEPAGVFDNTFDNTFE